MPLTMGYYKRYLTVGLPELEEGFPPQVQGCDRVPSVYLEKMIGSGSSRVAEAIYRLRSQAAFA